MIRHLAQAAEPLDKTAKGLRGGFTDLNVLLQRARLQPARLQARRATSSSSPWLNHNFNAIYFTQDAEGPLRRGLLIISCGTAKLAEFTAGANDLLKTELQATQLPTVGRHLPRRHRPRPRP